MVTKRCLRCFGCQTHNSTTTLSLNRAFSLVRLLHVNSARFNMADIYAALPHAKTELYCPLSRLVLSPVFDTQNCV